MDLILILTTAANAVVPVVLLILLGYWLRRINFVTQDFVKTGNKLVFNLFLPAMLFLNVYDLEGFDTIAWDLVLYASVMVFALFLIGIGFAALITKQTPRRGVILQACFRSNMAIIGLSLAAALGGDAAVGAASMLAAFTVPEFNILAVLSFTVFSDDKSAGIEKLKGVVKKIVRNPLIIAIAAGMLALLIRELQEVLFGQVVFSIRRDLKFLYTSLGNLKSVTTPFALVVLGGQFVFSTVKDYRKEIIGGVLFRIAFSPLIGIGVAALLSSCTDIVSFGMDAYPGMIALFGSPVAVSSAIMASQMDGDEQLATQLVVWSSVCSIFTIFITACILMAAGLLPM